MFCKNCGKKTEDNSKLCLECQPKNKHEDKKKLFDILLGGRIGRLRYFLYLLFFGNILGIILGVINIIFGLDVMLNSISFISLLYIPLTAKRLRDVNISGYYALPLYILSLLGELIFISAIFGIFLLFKKGNETVNAYGPPESNNKNIPWIVGGILVSFILLAIIFAI